MSTTINSFTLVGIEAVPVRVEVDLLRRLPRTAIVGLPADAAKETAERVRSAITAAGFEYPRQRIVINLAPADVRKTPASATDLPIAIGILVASGQIPAPRPNLAFYGELSLSGDVRPVRGTIAAAEAARRLGQVLVTSPDAPVGEVLHLRSLADIRHPLAEAPDTDWSHAVAGPPLMAPTEAPPGGQEILAAVRSGRPVLILSQLGYGANRAARWASDRLPRLTEDGARTVATITDAAGLQVFPIQIPFRAPHHTVSIAGMVGDRSLRPGECTLAHKGMLYLDEVEFFPRAVLDVVAAARRDGSIRITRFEGACTLPSRFALVGSVTGQESLERVCKHPLFADAVVVDLAARGVT